MRRVANNASYLIQRTFAATTTSLTLPSALVALTLLSLSVILFDSVYPLVAFKLVSFKGTQTTKRSFLLRFLPKLLAS